jgi:hypothetical protein
LYTEDQIEELVKVASLGNSTESRAALYQALDSVELYYRAAASVVDEIRFLSTPLLRLPDDTHAMMVYTSKSHPDLPQEFVGASWRRTLEIAWSIPRADWLILTNLGGNWLAINRRQVLGVLNSLSSEPDDPGERSNDSSGWESAKTSPDTLDSLISKAVRASAENWYDPVLKQLQGRELYVQLAAELSEDGQPVMVTSKVGDIRGLVQAHTSCSRPGITYGGMTWEAIVDMIENAPHIPGIHIINDNDDWIVLGRSEIQATKSQ